MITKVLWGIGSCCILIGAAIGIHSAFGEGEELPQLADDDNDTDISNC